ncbi:UNVERIFIED_CONTAM: hypothetical protein Slati_2433600 [Sesamum latifolium]|uniref:Uncharacterized protein n=1 Tax=Sesamum latifolium TaxID=2727402 RepID=A0AAW2WE14_9LAMI
MKSIGWTRQLAGRLLSSPRGSKVASHELAGCELTRSLGARSLACSSQVVSSPGPSRWLVARRPLARQDQVAGHQVTS